MMQQEFKMNREKKVYSKPLMEVVEMDYGPSILECSGDNFVCLDRDENAVDEE